MTWHRELWRRALSLAGRTRLDRDLDDEVAAHLECSIEDYRARGMTADEAKRAALRDFGGVARTKEAYREVRGFPLIESLGQDTRVALRVLRKSPVFTAVAVLTLALGIGANGTIFGVADSLLVRPLGAIDGARLAAVMIGQKSPAAPADFLDWQRSTTTFAELAAYRQRVISLTGVGAAERIYAAEVTPNFFATLQLAAAAGRTIAGGDVDEAVVVLTHGYRQRRFGGEANVVGRAIELDGRPHTVVGIMPPNVEIPVPTDVWLPMALVTRTLVVDASAASQAMTLLTIAGVVAGATILACCGPARLATRADPVESLRAD